MHPGPEHSLEVSFDIVSCMYIDVLVTLSFIENLFDHERIEYTTLQTSALIQSPSTVKEKAAKHYNKGKSFYK